MRRRLYRSKNTARCSPAAKIAARCSALARSMGSGTARAGEQLYSLGRWLAPRPQLKPLHGAFPWPAWVWGGTGWGATILPLIMSRAAGIPAKGPERRPARAARVAHVRARCPRRPWRKTGPRTPGGRWAGEASEGPDAAPAGGAPALLYMWAARCLKTASAAARVAPVRARGKSPKGEDWSSDP